MERKRTTATCRCVGTPDFAGLSRLDGKTQKLPQMQRLPCKVVARLAILDRIQSGICDFTSVLFGGVVGIKMLRLR